MLNVIDDRSTKRFTVKALLLDSLVIVSCAFLLMLGNVRLASASEEAIGGVQTNTSAQANEEILRLGLTPSLRMTCGGGLNPCLKITSLDVSELTDTVSSTSRLAMYRLYNRYTGEHFCTSDTSEKNNLVKIGWTYEGIGWYAPEKSRIPVYRLYNKWVSGGDHYYTTNKGEYESLKEAGWTQEGIGWYSVEKGEPNRVETYKQYNPYAQTGTHNYTTSKSENDSLVKVGWKGEGIAWYGYSSKNVITKAIDFSKAKVDTTSKTYTSKQIKPSASVTGLRAGTDYTVAYGTNKDAGTGSITITGKGDYTGSNKTYTFKIEKAKLTVVWANTVLTYNQEEQLPSAKLGGLLGTDKVTATVTGAQAEVGEGYVATASIYEKNYELAGETSTTFAIDKAPLSVKWSNTDLTYNTQPQKPTAEVFGALGEDSPTLTMEGEATNANTDKQKSYTAKAILDEESQKRYKIAEGETTEFKIGKATLDVTWTNTELEYFYDAQAPKATLSGILGEDKVTVKVEGAQRNASDVAYVATARIDNSNYEVSETTKQTKFTISRRKLTYATIGTTFTYDGKEHVPTIQLIGLVPDEAQELTKQIEISGAGKDAGQYVATWSFDNNNYDITPETINFTITKAKLDVTWSDTTAAFTYNGTPQAPSVTLTGVVEGETAPTPTISGAQTDSGKDYVATVSLDDKNYELNSKATLTKKFSIDPADPVCPTPNNLTAEVWDLMSDVALPVQTGEDGRTKGKWQWLDGNTDVGGEVTRVERWAQFVPDDTKNYTSPCMYLTIVVTEKTSIKAKFVANAPNGVQAKVDDKDEEAFVYTFDEGSKVHTLINSSFPTSIEITSEDTKNWVFVGWSTDSKTTSFNGIAQDQLVGTQLSKNVTYYAIWMQESGYWLGTKDASAEYVDEVYFATHDANYVPASTIKTDMDNVHNSSYDYTSQQAIISKWKGYFNEDRRLYATYAGGENEPSYNNGPTSALNKYVEFRIINVYDSWPDSDTDGASVTFMATHVLPTAYEMNEGEDTNIGGWEASTLKSKMNEDGEIYKKFSEDFTSLVKSIKKTYSYGDTTGDNKTGNYKFWLIGNSEIGLGQSSGMTTLIEEGGQYAWFKNQGISSSAITSEVLANWKTRAKATPGSAESKASKWWQRTRVAFNQKNFLCVDTDGNASTFSVANGAWGVVPCFAF